MSIVEELKNRKVFRVAAVYLVASWLIVQIVDVIAGPMLLPEWFTRVVILLLVIGFPIALIMSWAFDATPASESGTTAGKPLAIGLIAVTAVVAGFVIAGFDTGNTEPQAVAGETAGDPATESTQVSLPAPLPPAARDNVIPNSVAVLLCDNLSPDPDDAFFSAGIHEEILNQLVKLSALKVIARTSVLQYAEDPPPISEIADELNVQSVVECSVRFAGTSIMVTAQLIDPTDNSHLWSESYPGDIGDLNGVFAMQADIAMNIANALNAEFSLGEQAAIEEVPTQSSEAYALYLEAMSRGGMQKLRLLARVIEIDPEFAPAYAERARLQAFLVSFGFAPGSDLETQAREAAQRAIELNPNLAHAHTALGTVYELQLDAVQAEAAHQRAFELSPNDVEVLRQYARFKRTRGEYEISIELLEQAVELDPKAAAAWHNLGLAHLFSGDGAAALHAYVEALAVNPSSAQYMRERANAYYLNGEPELAELSLQLADMNQNWAQVSFFQRAQSAIAWQRLGNQAEADRMFAELAELLPEGSPPNLSLMYALVAVDELDRALEELRRVLEADELPPLNVAMEVKANRWRNPVFEEPRFVELIDQLGYQD